MDGPYHSRQIRGPAFLPPLTAPSRRVRPETSPVVPRVTFLILIIQFQEMPTPFFLYPPYHEPEITITHRRLAPKPAIPPL